MSMTTDELLRRFRYRGGSLLAPWRDIRGDATGDCQDVCWTVLLIETGSVPKALLALLTLRAVIWRCWSPVSGVIPRHAVLRYRGNFIDSTTRYWRPDASPHRRAYPVGLPVLIGLAWAAKMFGYW